MVHPVGLTSTSGGLHYGWSGDAPGSVVPSNEEQDAAPIATKAVTHADG